MEKYALIPEGHTKEHIKAREKIIKDFYANWMSENPDKKIWNDSLSEFIHVKFLSINETYNKAARNPESTAAVLKLSEILSKAVVTKIKPAKKNDRNQKSFDSMFIMRYEDIKLIVGNQVSTKQKVQYSISVSNKKSH